MTDVQAILAALRPPVVLAGCARCGANLPPVRDFDCQVSPRGGMIPATSLGVCERCLATAHDRTGRLSRAVKDGDGETREGWTDPAARDIDDRTGEAVRKSNRGRKAKPAPAVAGPAAGRLDKLVTGRGAHDPVEHYVS